jgi:hypothetical protein
MPGDAYLDRASPAYPLLPAEGARPVYRYFDDSTLRAQQLHRYAYTTARFPEAKRAETSKPRALYVIITFIFSPSSRATRRVC